MKKIKWYYFVLLTQFIVAQSATNITVGSTIMKIKTATFNNQQVAVGSNYDGNIIAVTYSGTVLWETPLSNGIMNHELWTEDINADGDDEVLAANANGTLYCLDKTGAILWTFKQNDVPLISTCVIHKAGGVDPYVVCGGNDLSIYYISASDGSLISEIPSSSYRSNLVPNQKWVDDGTLPRGVHSVNFLRPIPQSDGSDHLLLEGVVANTNHQRQFFEFETKAVSPIGTSRNVFWRPSGDAKVRTVNGRTLLMLGYSGITVAQGQMAVVDITTGVNRLERDDFKIYNFKDIRPFIPFGYRVGQTEVVTVGGVEQFFILMGDRIYLAPTSMNLTQAEIDQGTELLTSSFSFNDMCYDKENNKILLASIQSGGNQIHVLDLNNASWKSDYESLQPGGTIASILRNASIFSNRLKNYRKPDRERDPMEIYMMTGPQDGALSAEARVLKNKFDNLKFMGNRFQRFTHNTPRTNIVSESLRTERDARYRYTITQNEVFNNLTSIYNENGLSAWGGHGVDPFMFGLETIKSVIDAGGGKKSIWIWPELTILHKDTFDEALDKLFYPLAEHGKDRNAKIFMRSKHIFWQTYIYNSDFSRFLSGEFADVLVPSMEETQDQTQDLSIASRLGLWASGVANDWGTRYARDNTTFMRNREFSHQNVPNHALRHAIFHTAYGARYVNNFALKSDYSEHLTLLWELLGSGALYVPKPEEVLSFSPVHLSMINPDEVYVREGESMDATTRYDKSFHPNNPFVFNRLSSDWAGAEVPDWDFSKYASGVQDRRLNFLAPYPNGMVLITPPQNGVNVQENVVRAKLEDRLHPFYKDRLKEYYTDGRYYYSADREQQFDARQYHTVIENEIKAAAVQLPVSVSGDIAWVVAQTAPKHFRLTLIDNGYINPKTSSANVKFNNLTGVKITDILTNSEISASDDQAFVGVPAGMFRLLDVEFETWNQTLSDDIIEQPVESNSFYPNPALDKVTISIQENIDGFVTILNATGSTVKKMYVQKDKNEEYELDISAINPGLYFIVINNKSYKLVIGS